MGSWRDPATVGGNEPLESRLSRREPESHSRVPSYVGPRPATVAPDSGAPAGERRPRTRESDATRRSPPRGRAVHLPCPPCGVSSTLVSTVIWYRVYLQTIRLHGHATGLTAEHIGVCGLFSSLFGRVAFTTACDPTVSVDCTCWSTYYSPSSAALTSHVLDLRDHTTELARLSTSFRLWSPAKAAGPRYE
jgi:hypothetical protein